MGLLIKLLSFERFKFGFRFDFILNEQNSRLNDQLSNSI